MIIRDAIHGDIEITGEEQELLDTDGMQRLRGIKQLGTAYLVYPGCLHTRFEHSLGTLATTSRLLSALAKRGYPAPPQLSRLVRICALVHDISHLPFGHTFEDEIQILPRHDTPRRLLDFLARGDTAEVLARQGLQDDVISVLTGGAERRGLPPWLGELVSGTVDADLLDYVRRDAYYAGLPQTYDDRILAYLVLADGHLTFDLTRHGMERPDARSELAHLLRLRYFLSERLYYHHAKVASGAMVAKAVELACQAGLTLPDLYMMSDFTLLACLPDLLSPGTIRASVERLLASVRTRRLYKRAYVLSLEGTGEQAQKDLIARFRGDQATNGGQAALRRQAAERELARAAGIPSDRVMDAVIVYCAPATTMKEADIPVITTAGRRPFSAPHVGGRDLVCLGEMYKRLWRFYVFCPAEYRGPVGQAAASYLGYPNEYQTPGAPHLPC